MPHNQSVARPIRRSFDLRAELLERMKDASAATGLSLNAIAEQAFEREIAQLGEAYNCGNPFPERDPSSAGGRKMAPRRAG